MESIVSVVLGLAIGFIASSLISTAIIVAILVIPLIIYAIILLSYKNKISIIAILDNELKNRHYENVIIMGLQLSSIMFNTKQNANRIKIGRKVEEAIISCDRELSEIIIDGKELSKELILVKLNIDDLGWSLYQLDKKRWTEAVDSILKGIFSAEKMAIEHDSNNDSRSIDFIQMSLKGYRHLVGIFLDNDIKKIKDGIMFEKVIKAIISIGHIVDNNGLTNFANLTPLKIHENAKLKSYLIDDDVEGLYLKDFVDDECIQRLQNCMTIYSKLEDKEKNKIVNDLYYAFSRNNVKLLKIAQNSDEKEKLIHDAKNYALLYKGNEKNTKSKKWIRYRSLMNELNVSSSNKNNIANIIQEVNDTIMQCSTRTDLFFRNSTLLVSALKSQFELSFKNNSTLTNKQKKEKIQSAINKMGKIKEDVKKVDIIIDEDFLKTYKQAKDYFKQELNALK